MTYTSSASGDILDKFPQARRALEDNINIKFVLLNMDGIDSGERVPRHLASIIDEHVEATPVEKDAMLVCALYTFDPETMVAQVNSFADRYSPQAQEYALEMIIARAQSETFSPLVASLSAAVHITMMEQFMRIALQKDFQLDVAELSAQKVSCNEVVDYLAPLLPSKSLKDLMLQAQAAHHAIVGVLFDAEMRRQNPGAGGKTPQAGPSAGA